MTIDDIRKNLDSPQCYDISLYDEVSSTNIIAKDMGNSGAREGTVIIADTQNAGRGRMSRKFFSPPASGLYMSILLRPASAESIALITPAAAVAVCRAIEKLTDKKPKIKWVNDILIENKKVCGILTETAFDENGKIKYAILGTGVNVFSPKRGFPEGISGIAGCVTEYKAGFRSLLAAGIINEFFALYPGFDSVPSEYGKRCAVIGKNVEITSFDGKPPRSATVIGIDNNCNLLVRRGDSTEETVFSGEISIKLMN